MPPTFAACTFALNRTGIADFSFRFVDQNLLGGSSRNQGKDLSLRTDIMIFLRVILKEISWIILGALAKIGCRKVSLDPAFFESNNIGHGTVSGIAHSK